MRKRENLPELCEPMPCRDLVMTHVANVRSIESLATMVLCVREDLIGVSPPTDVLRAKVRLYVPLPRVVPNLLAVIQELGLTDQLLAELRTGVRGH